MVISTRQQNFLKHTQRGHKSALRESFRCELKAIKSARLSCVRAVCLSLLCVAPAAKAQVSNSAGVSLAPERQAASPAQKMQRARETPVTDALNAANSAPPVVAVLHRLRGWRLHALLTTPDAVPDSSSFDNNFVRTNVVAGYLLPDGHSVIARLPLIEAEMLNLTANLPTTTDTSTSAADETAELFIVRADGTQLPVSFVGLDSRSGLSLLEVAAPFESPAQAQVAVSDAPPFIVGQRVRVIAPLPAAPMAQAGFNSATMKPTTPTPTNDSAPVGEAGVTYMNMGEAEGELRDIKRSLSGRSIELTLTSDQLSPEWAGGIALSESGALVGIVEESGDRQARLAPAATVRAAATRVRARRAGIPQPWLGVRGEAIASTSCAALTAHGWSLVDARALRAAGAGLLVSEVAPDTPAADAGLLSGDVIRRIGAHEVQTNEDMSSLLDELGGNVTTQLVILRPSRPRAPRAVTLRLSEAINPALATAQAELRAAQRDARLAEASQAGRSSAGTRETGMALTWARFRLDLAERRVREASSVHANPANRALLPYGLQAVNVPTNLAARFGTRGGLLIVGVRPASPAAACGVRAGDVIEKIDGRSALTFDARPEAKARDNALALALVRSGQQISVKLTATGIAP